MWNYNPKARGCLPAGTAWVCRVKTLCRACDAEGDGEVKEAKGEAQRMAAIC